MTNWQDTLIDLIELELEQCPQEKACFINHITRFVDKTIERKLAEERKRRKEEKCITAKENYKWGRLAERNAIEKELNIQ